MEDDHVDRPGVEERQRLKLTGTNSSIGLIVLITYIHPGAIRRIVAILTHACSALTGGATWVRRISADDRSTLRSFASKGARPNEHPGHNKDQRTAWRKQQIGSPIGYSLSAIRSKSFSIEHAFCRPGGYGGAAAPDPIPNSAVKRSSADGTSSQDAGE